MGVFKKINFGLRKTRNNMSGAIDNVLDSYTSIDEELFDEQFFYNRGATTRYILGRLLAALYGIYYVIAKRTLYRGQIGSIRALMAIFRGIAENKIGRQKQL